MNIDQAYSQTLRSLKDQEAELLERLSTVRTAITAITELMPNRPVADAAVRRAAGGKPGTLAHQVYSIILREARPMRVMEIAERLQAKGIGRDQPLPNLRATIAGMISRKKREKDSSFIMLGDGMVTINGVGTGTEVTEPVVISTGDQDDADASPESAADNDAFGQRLTSGSEGEDLITKD